MNKQKNNAKGITLVALVITIIVLVILVGVTLSVAINTGLINNSKTSVAEYSNEQTREEQHIQNVADIVEEHSGGNVKGVDYSELTVGDYVNYPVYYDNVGTSVDTSTGEIKGNIPADKYNGWRILSIEGEGENAYIRLVSAGVPLNYYEGVSGASVGIRNLTTGFFNTSIENSVAIDTFYKCGFKTAKENGTAITDINSLKDLFTNKFTATYASGEVATYTDIESGTICQNSEVVGYPKVQAMSKADVDTVWGSDSYYGNLAGEDLLAIPCKGNESNEYAQVFLASYYPTYDTFYSVWNTGLVYTAWDLLGGQSGIMGVRPVVTLKPKVKFTQAESNAEDVKTWNIAM